MLARISALEASKEMSATCSGLKLGQNRSGSKTLAFLLLLKMSRDPSVDHYSMSLSLKSFSLIHSTGRLQYLN